MRLLYDVDEKLVPGTLRFEPDRIQAKQEIAKRLTSRVGGVHNGNALYILHSTTE
jgi:hypothetical protein